MVLKSSAWVHIVVFLLVLYLGDLSNISCLMQPRYVPIGQGGLQGTGQVYFVPFASFPQVTLERFVDFYRKRDGLAITILPALTLPAQAFNSVRGQYVAESLIHELELLAHSTELEPDSTIIGLTDQDIFIDQYN